MSFMSNHPRIPSYQILEETPDDANSATAVLEIYNDDGEDEGDKKVKQME